MMKKAGRKPLTPWLTSEEIPMFFTHCQKHCSLKFSSAVAACSMILSVLLYLLFSALIGFVSIEGIIGTAVISAFIAPVISYIFLRFLIRLEIVQVGFKENEDRYRSIAENSGGVHIVNGTAPWADDG
jgi:hypothetical protein